MVIGNADKILNRVETVGLRSPFSISEIVALLTPLCRANRRWDNSCCFLAARSLVPMSSLVGMRFFFPVSDCKAVKYSKRITP
jgi:hypothetical protein